MESEAEFFDMEIAVPLVDPAAFAVTLSGELPPGMEVISVTAPPAKAPAAFLVSYHIALASPLTEAQLSRIEAFFTRESMVVAQVRKGMRREVDIRPLVKKLEGEGRSMHLELLSIPGRAGISARAVLTEVAELSEDQALLARISKAKVVGQTAIP
jgi:hypothetical protein